jgi:hypothetical protein
LETGSRLIVGLPWDVLIESWNLSSRIELFNNRDMSKYSLFHIFPFILSDTRQSTERLVEVNNVEGISAWLVSIPDSTDCAVATALDTRVSARGAVEAGMGWTRGASRSRVESTGGWGAVIGVNCSVTALVTCCTMLAIISCGIVHCDVGCGVVCVVRTGSAFLLLRVGAGLAVVGSAALFLAERLKLDMLVYI